MNNGSNQWGVAFNRITWLEAAIRSHQNVESVERRDDIVFDVVRRAGGGVTIVCLDEYTLGIAAAQRVAVEFPGVNFISVGGNWNCYTWEAKEWCLTQRIGLYNSSELSGALWKNEHWNYFKRDKDGDALYPLREE